jgi:hypothetical protein
MNPPSHEPRKKMRRFFWIHGRVSSAGTRKVLVIAPWSRVLNARRLAVAQSSFSVVSRK